MPGELKPCPFCGNAFAKVGLDQFYVVWTIYCLHCGSEGPASYSAESAEQNWNTRLAEPGAPGGKG